MKIHDPNPNDDRANFARTEQEVPLFPYRPVYMPSDGWEQAENDFMQQAGMPYLASDADHPDQQR